MSFNFKDFAGYSAAGGLAAGAANWLGGNDADEKAMEECQKPMKNLSNMECHIGKLVKVKFLG